MAQQLEQFGAEASCACSSTWTASSSLLRGTLRLRAIRTSSSTLAIVTAVESGPFKTGMMSVSRLIPVSWVRQGCGMRNGRRRERQIGQRVEQLGLAWPVAATKHRILRQLVSRAATARRRQ